jgi:hypothetical protein
MKMMKVSIMIFFMLIFVSTSHSFFSFNETGLLFDGDENGNGNKSLAPGAQLNNSIINGAGYFIKSHSDFLLFLSKIETSGSVGLNFTELREILSASQLNLEMAKESYLNLCEIANKTAYNQSLLQQLLQFNYLKYERKNRLNSAVFNQVTGFLSKGDIRGAYKNYYTAITDLLEKTMKMKADIDSDLIPNLSELWRINQNYSEMLLFGQYATEVVYCIIEGNE